MRARRTSFRSLIVKAIVIAILVVIFKTNTATSQATGTVTTASATLTNSRLSYKSSINASGETAGTTVIDIDNESADDNTNHLFPGDTVCFSNPAESGCHGNTTYTVAGITDSDTFTITSALGDNLVTGDFVVASASGNLTVAFDTATEIPSSGTVTITLPSVDTNNKTNDGIPDTAAAIANSGFDIKGSGTAALAAADVSFTGCTFNATETITAGGASSNTTIVATLTATCAAASTITMTTSNNKILNPAPYTSHTQGVADVYSIDILTEDSGGTDLDSGSVRVAPVEAVLVSATVDETLSFTVAGLSSSTSTCGQTTDVTTQAYSVPWGTIASTGTFYEGSQQLTVSTNATSGYSVTVEEDDQLNKDSDACDSPTAATADYTDGCIQDTTCGASACSESTSQDWTDASTYPGFGFSLANQAGSDAAFLYNESSRTFSTRQIADQQASETKQSIMSNAGPVNSNDVYVCFRIAISGLQPAGYYTNIVKYVATPTF